VSSFEIFHVANFDARERSNAFSRQRISAARMTEVLHWRTLYGLVAQNLADVPETTKLRSPERRGHLFQE
jgi:hypothetical protein